MILTCMMSSCSFPTNTCIYAEPEFGISLINSSPQVTNGTITVGFVTNQPISFAHCFLTGQRAQNCESISEHVAKIILYTIKVYINLL